MSAQGRGPDSALVHMSPRELSGLQSLAMAHGGTLTINPETGLPEAGFLDSILPTLLGGAATFFSGGTITPFMAALGVGGLTALTSKDLGKGLMAGLGAYGGAGIAGGLMNFGEAAIGAEAAKGALPSGIDPVGADAGAYEMGQAAAAKTARAGATNFDRLSTGITEGFKNPMGAFSAIGGGSKLQGAAMLGAPLLSALSTQDQTSVPTAEQIKFDPRYANINISRQQRPYQPDTGSSGERRYFGDTYVTQYADGGAVANDGIEHFAYGGGTIDPTYDYSGYGDRSKNSGMRPIAYTEAPKPDFVAADGKTYRYDPVKKSWYVIKEAETKKVNAGVETLMGEGPGGGQDRAPGPGPGGGYGIPGATMSGGISGPTTGLASGANSLAATLGNMSGGKGILGGISDTLARNIDPNFSHEGRTGKTSPIGGGFTLGPDGLTSMQTQGIQAANPMSQDPAQAQAEAQAAVNGRPGGGDIAQGSIGPVGGYSPGTEGSASRDSDTAEGQANGGMIGHYAQGGLGSLGGYSDGGRLLRGPGDGVSDSIPATVGNRQPARLADGEFVVPARIVSELGNGSTEAGARALYKMMDRIQANRRKTTGKNSVAVNSKSHKYLPA